MATAVMGRGEWVFSGDRLREIRLARGWSQEQLAQASGFRATRISRLENNHVRDPRFSTVLTLAEALGCSADELHARGNDG